MTKYKTQFAQRKADIKADYEMSRTSRFVRQRLGTAPMGGSADYHYRSESQYYNDMEKCRDMDRNDSIVGQTIDRSVANVVQDGFTLEPKTGDSKLDLDLWQRWQDWAGNPDQCDISGEMCWHDFELKGYRSHLIDGDSTITLTTEGALQFLEAHTIQTTTSMENTFCGVTMDQYRKRLKFWVMQDGLTPSKQKEKAKPIDVRDPNGHRQVFQIYNPRRANQTRGVSALAPIFYITGMLEDINFAKVVQQQMVSCFAVFRQRAASNSTDGTPPSMAGYGESSTATSATGQTKYLEGIGPGMEIIGAAGEQLMMDSPKVPNAEYFQQVRMLLQIIGANLGLPLCLVLMDGSETNFSGWRGAVDEARKGFRANQAMLKKRQHRPIYEGKVRQWIEKDRALKRIAGKRGINILGHEWHSPQWKYINPREDSEGDAARIRNGQTSYRRLHTDNSTDWETIAEEQIADTAYAIVRAKAKAKEINDEFNDGAPVNWRDLINLVTPSGVTMNLQDPEVLKTQQETAKEPIQ
jgi:lambda family phage portal protein